MSSSWDDSLRIWDSGRGACILQLTSHTDTVFSVVQLADGRIVSGIYDDTLQVWDSGSGSCILQLKGHSYVVFCVV